MVALTDSDQSTVGILAFETATAISRLLSLHQTLSDPAILALRSHTLRSQGLAYLTSTDQLHLLRLSAAELLLLLDLSAAFISRLSLRSPDAIPFPRLYSDLKSGRPLHPRLNLTDKSLRKTIKKLENHVQTTCKLFTEMEILSELEASERKKWGRLSGPIPMQKPNKRAGPQLDLKAQAQKVRSLKDCSLWSCCSEKVVDLMALSCFSIFERICVIFGPYVPGLPRALGTKENSTRMFFSGRGSGPLVDRTRAGPKEVTFRNSCPIIGCSGPEEVNWAEMLRSGPNTVGGAGMGLRYANIIVGAEKVMREGEAADEEREELYEMLPLGMKLAVKVKLREWWRDRGPGDSGLAGGWKDAVWRILGWLGPVAHDTVEWEAERSMDRLQRFEWGSKKLMVQTLHFSDKEKTEAAIVEVLVGLSLICWYDQQRCSGPSCRYI